jgi:hypothetical protein
LKQTHLKILAYQKIRQSNISPFENSPLTLFVPFPYFPLNLKFPENVEENFKTPLPLYVSLPLANCISCFEPIINYYLEKVQCFSEGF